MPTLTKPTAFALRPKRKSPDSAWTRRRRQRAKNVSPRPPTPTTTMWRTREEWRRSATRWPRQKAAALRWSSTRNRLDRASVVRPILASIYMAREATRYFPTWVATSTSPPTSTTRLPRCRETTKSKTRRQPIRRPSRPCRPKRRPKSSIPLIITCCHRRPHTMSFWLPQSTNSRARRMMKTAIVKMLMMNCATSLEFNSSWETIRSLVCQPINTYDVKKLIFLYSIIDFVVDFFLWALNFLNFFY